MEIRVGDVVAIRGDLRVHNDGRCEYTPDQLVDGKYLRHTGHGGIWTGVVEKIQDTGVGLRALVGGRWIWLYRCEVMACGSPRNL